MNESSQDAGDAIEHYQHLPSAVVALAGARDHYQVPLALHEAGLLRSLVTECYWPADRALFRSVAKLLKVEKYVEARYCAGLPSEQVHVSKRAFAINAVRKITRADKLNRQKDRVIGLSAKRIAESTGAAVLSYSYYASEIFKAAGDTIPHRFLFQLHPHPTVVRNILMEEMERTPSARDSLQMEHELNLAEKEYAKMAEESHLANGWIVASQFTAASLTTQGISASRIHVVPYGVNVNEFSEREHAPRNSETFSIVYVGSVVQRKGISYLLDAIRALQSRHVRLVICTRGFLDQRLLQQYSDLTIELKLGLDKASLVREIRACHVMVLPSLAEGFAHVILEAMACGLPVITTPNTCGPDVIPCIL